MTRMRIVLAMWLLAASVSVPALLVAQVPVQAPETQVTPPSDPDVGDVVRSRGAAVRIGRDFRLLRGEEVRQVVTIAGNATIEGHVDRDVTVVLGTLRLASTAVIDQSVVVVGGSTIIEPGATVNRDLVVIGSGYQAPPEFMPGGEHIVIGTMMGGALESLGTWFSRGLLYGRVIVPGLPWVWGIVALIFLVYLALNLILDRPIRVCAKTLATRPLTTFGVGLLVLLLIGPVCLLLAVSVIGIAVVPFVLCALLAGWVIGKVAVARCIGMSVVPESENGAESSDSLAAGGNRAHGTRSLTIGFVLMTLTYMVPILGIVLWAILGVLGLGSAALSFIAAYRQENPKPVASAPERPAVSPPFAAPPAAPTTYQYSDVSARAVEPPPAASFDAPPATAAAAVFAPAAAASYGVLASMPKALFRDRLAAFVLDIILMLIVVNVFDSNDPANALFIGLLVYHVGLWTWKQTTIGGIICQLRVARVNGAPLTFADALVRGLASIFSLAVLGIGALWILKDSESQAWHDKIAGTYVVKVPRNWPL